MRSAVFVLILAATVRADLPSPRFDRIFPLGAAAGTSVEVEVSGADLDEPKALLFDHPGIKAEPLKDRKFKVTVAADVLEGTYDARVVGKHGVSSPRLFAVSHGLAEVVEKEPNDEPATAQLVAINSAVSGTSDGNKDDVFKFPARKGQRIVLDCQAGKLDSMLDGTLTLTAADGRLLATSGGYNGRDPLIDFVAPSDGEYFAAVHDRSYRGGFPYRLVITDRPQVEAVFPRAVQAGKPQTVTVYGRNLGPGSKPSTWTVGGLALEEREETVTAPADALDRGLFRFTDHPTRHSVLPTAATATLTGFQVHGVPVLVTADPVTREAEPNDDRHRPQPIALPAVVAGRFDRERDADWYEFEAPADGAYSFEVYCERVAGRADPYLVVLDDKDNRVAELDDFGPRVEAFDAHLRDPSGTVSLAGKKKYRVLVQDRYRRGGAQYQYVLTVRPPVPDFDVAVIHSQNPGPGGTTVRKGGAAYLDVILQRKGGFNGPITITADGLPRGLHAAPTTIPTDSRGVLVFWADADAADSVGPVRLTATGKAEGTTLNREARQYTRVWPQPDMNSSRPTRELVVAVAEVAPFALRPAVDQVEVTAGRKAEVKYQLGRAAGFTGAVTVTPLAFPGPVRANQVTIADGQADGVVTFDVTGGAPAGEYTLAVRGQAQVAVEGPKGKANTLVTLPARPVTLVVHPAAKK
ncbi:MAG: PPC domain-containing protein [Zavarzinella sp.]|nr:PPC domain-containing protein [Zavarzinella sp.]